MYSPKRVSPPLAHRVSYNNAAATNSSSSSSFRARAHAQPTKRRRPTIENRSSITIFLLAPPRLAGWGSVTFRKMERMGHKNDASSTPTQHERRRDLSNQPTGFSLLFSSSVLYGGERREDGLLRIHARVINRLCALP